MEISKFIIGVFTVAIGLWQLGQLVPATMDLGARAAEAQKDGTDFKHGKWSIKLTHH